MGKSITITVRLADTDFAQDYEVDPERPLVELVRRVAKDQDVPLVTRQGRPLAWEAEGPDWREGKTGRTDLTRTQPLDRIATRVLADEGEKSPLFMITVTIPGAAEALEERAEEAKRAEIEARLAQREAERAAAEAEHKAAMEAMGPGLDGDEDIVTERVPAITDGALEDQATEPMGAPPQRPGAIDIRTPGAPTRPRRPGEGGQPVEQRIRRAGTQERRGGPGTQERRGGPGTQERRARKPGSGGRRKKSKKKAGVLFGLPMGAVIGIAAGGVLMLGLLVTVIAVSVGGDDEPTVTPTATITPVPDVVVDIPVVTPPPTPAPTVATPPPVKFVTFFSKGTVDRNSAGSAGAQISSFAKSEVKLGYRVNLASSGSHTVGLKGRFTLKVSDGGSTLSGGSTKSCRAVTVGKEAKVSLHWTGDRVTAWVNGGRCGPVSVAGTSGFPAWKFSFDPGVTITGLWAKAPAEE